MEEWEKGLSKDERAEEGCSRGFGMKLGMRYVNPSSDSIGWPPGNVSDAGTGARGPFGDDEVAVASTGGWREVAADIQFLELFTTHASQRPVN